MRSYSSYQKYRKWEKVIEPLSRYNRNTGSLAYPLDLFFQLQQKISAGHPLALNIATTLTGCKDNCIKTVFEGDQDVGSVVFVPSMLKSTFDSEIQKEMQDRLTRFTERDAQFDTFYSHLKQTSTSQQFLPLAVLKQKQESGQCLVLTLSHEQFKKTVNIESHQIAQSFIFGSGKQSSIIRFFYNPTKKNSEAYKIDNYEGFMKRRLSKNQFKIRQQIQNSLTFVKIMYTNKTFYRQTLNLVDFLERYKKIKINRIVTDWILDPLNRYFLIDVKEVTYSNIQQIHRPIKIYNEGFAFVSCQMCQQKFRQDELTKIITDRLIRQFFEHLKKRQIHLSFDIIFKPNNATSKVCDLCYSLVVSQSELIELEKKVAGITHSTNQQKTPSAAMLNYKKGQMFQWRLFLYLEDIRDLNIENIDPKANYFIMLKIHNSITSFKLKNIADRYLLIKGIKIHYLFSQTQKIDSFLVNSSITLRITKGNHWNNVIAEGNTSGLYEQSQKHSMRKFKQILVFNQKSQYSVVGIHIGVKMEGRYDPSHLALHKTHQVYMVEDGYSNCYAFPAEWMETIDPSYCITKSDSARASFHMNTKGEKRGKLPTLVPQGKRKLIL